MMVRERVDISHSEGVNLGGIAEVLHFCPMIGAEVFFCATV